MYLDSDHCSIRVDLRIIAGMIESGSRVLDIGCGDGVLLATVGAPLEGAAEDDAAERFPIPPCIFIFIYIYLFFHLFLCVACSHT